jgi:hypothetical protein
MRKKNVVIGKLALVLLLSGMFLSFAAGSYAASPPMAWTTGGNVVCLQFTFVHFPEEPAKVGTSTTTKMMFTENQVGSDIFYTISGVQVDKLPKGPYPQISLGAAHMTGSELVMSTTFSSAPPFTASNPPFTAAGTVVLNYSLTPPSGNFFTIGTVNVGSASFPNVAEFYSDGTVKVVTCP